MVKNWIAEGLDEANMVNKFLHELEQLVTRYKERSPTCQSSPCSPLETSRQQEGPSGGRLDITQRGCGSLAPIVECFKKNHMRRDASSVSRSDATQRDCRSSISTISGIRKIQCAERQVKPARGILVFMFSDSQVVDAALKA